MTSAVVLAIDAGQTGLRVRAPDGHERTSAVATTPLVDLVAVDRLLTALRPVTSGVPTGASVGLGVTGYPTDPQVQRYLADGLRRDLAVERVAIASDVVTSYLGTVGDGPGVVAVWGTGAVALASDGTATCHRVDGRGYVLGDLGSGYWIAQQGLRAALDAVEGRGPATSLAAAAGRWGGTDVYTAVYRADPLPGHVAGFARAVIDAAAQGDAIAEGILAGASDEVARTVLAAARTVGIADDVALQVGVTGGVSGAAQTVRLLTAALSAARTGPTTLRVVASAPMDGAERLAVDREAPLRFPGWARIFTEDG